MRVQSDLETRLHADAQELDRDFPKTASLERQILARVAITTREQRRSLTRRQEMVLAAVLVVAVALLAIGVAQLRAKTKPGPAQTPAALSTGTSSSACPPAPGVWMNATTGWQGDPDRTDWYGLPLRTTDGGLHWQPVQVPPSGGNILKTGSTSCFLDANHAWVTLQALGEPLVIYLTTDGGRSWQSGDPVPGGVPELIARLAFLDAQRGWLLTDAQGMPGCATLGQPHPSTRTIYSTSDGGLHWKQIVQACTGDGSTLGTLATGCSETGLTFIDGNTGWLTWDCGPPSSPLVPAVLDRRGFPTPVGPMVASTRDGGRSWQRVALPSYPSSGQSACVTWPPVFTRGHGVLPTSCRGTGQSAVFCTDDGGRSWSLLRSPSEGDRTVNYFIDASSGWEFSRAGGSNALAPNGNDLYRTTDGGRDWVLVRRGLFSGDAVLSVQFLDDSVGFVFIMDPTNAVDELKTTDGGQTWAVVRTAPGG